MFKQNYRRELIRRIEDDSTTLEAYLKSLNVKELCHLGGKAWAAVSSSCVEKCWEKGLEPAFSSCQSTTEDDDDEPDLYGFTEEDVCEAEKLSEWSKEERHQWHSADDECLTI